METVNVLLVFARPKDAGSMSLLSEFRSIRNALRDTDPERRRVSLTILPAASIDDLQTALLADRAYHLLHISSHGMSGHLEFEDPSGERQLVRGKAFAEFIKRSAPPLQCVILNGCETYSIAKRLSTFLPFAVGMQGKVDDEASQLFSQGFYRRLGAGLATQAGVLDIVAAYTEGVHTVNLHPVPNDHEEAKFEFRPHLLQSPRVPAVVASTAASWAAPANGAPESPEISIVAKSIQSGEEVPLKVRRDASIAWTVSLATAGLGLKGFADVGALNPLKVRWVIIDSRAVPGWEKLDVRQAITLRALVNTPEGLRASMDDSARLQDLGIGDGFVFHLYPVQDFGLLSPGDSGEPGSNSGTVSAGSALALVPRLSAAAVADGPLPVPAARLVPARSALAPIARGIVLASRAAKAPGDAPAARPPTPRKR